MAYPAIDADTVAAYELDEIVDGALSAPIPGFLAPFGDIFDVGDAPRFTPKFHTPPHFGGWFGFANDATGNLEGVLYDTVPGSATTWVIGVPGPFGDKRAVAFRQGTASDSRSYLLLPVGALPTGAVTVSMWLQPFQGTGAVWEILHKEYYPTDPVDGVLAGTWSTPFYGGLQLYALSTSSGQWGASINIAGTVHSVSITGNSFERYFLRYGQWNHIGATYDGAVFCIYINGQLASSLTVSGAIDYGSGRWVCGCTRDGGGALFQMNAAAQRIRFEQVAKDAQYFFDCYTSVGGGGGSPPVVTF